MGAQHISMALEINTTLKVLCLSCNDIGDSGAKHIAKALESNAALETLYLNRNNISDMGAQHISEALKHNTMLKTLLYFGETQKLHLPLSRQSLYL